MVRNPNDDWNGPGPEWPDWLIFAGFILGLVLLVIAFK